MPSVSPFRVALVAACVAVLAGVLDTPASASSPASFSLAPADGTPYPRFAPEPGQTVRGTLRLTSRSSRVRVVRLQTLALTTANSGGIQFAGDKSDETSSWLRLSRTDVRLRPRASTTVRFTAEVPADAAPGEHYAGLAAVDRAELRNAAAKPDKGARGVALNRVTRVALPVRLWVPGDAARRLDLRDMTFAANAAGSHLDLDLGNTGRRLVRETAVDLRVSRDGKQLFRHTGDLAEFVPGTRIRYAVAWRGKPKAGTYHVSGTVTPKGAAPIEVDRDVEFAGAEAKQLEERTGDPAAPADDLPFLLIGAFALVLLVAASAVVAYVRLRRRVAHATA